MPDHFADVRSIVAATALIDHRHYIIGHCVDPEADLVGSAQRILNIIH